ncbi:uncharacterized protein MELLADRAFT_66914 [Melampsora larici-populina 98AG31]|uniref:Uncharacterized protein n=1 Tax=Melampsora larici-populina (strain 98AG31 / pathotype 3-4-7) TaxID=747676 RepID=F4S132_MELLP|nr:uncharacterized protein MELLADRAFT_66914 [Melampsora larici-populina 98AG31]EGG01710.1 hypothetical protein MELLADRAFT_66914 [Melampsora larici-populina 98AG31]
MSSLESTSNENPSSSPIAITSSSDTSTSNQGLMPPDDIPMHGLTPPDSSTSASTEEDAPVTSPGSVIAHDDTQPNEVKHPDILTPNNMVLCSELSTRPYGHFF